MVPAKSDPRWRRFVTHTQDFELKSLPARIMCQRVRMLLTNQSENNVLEAIDIAHEFFSQNERRVADDLKCILG